MARWTSSSSRSAGVLQITVLQLGACALAEKENELFLFPEHAIGRQLERGTHAIASRNGQVEILAIKPMVDRHERKANGAEPANVFL